MPFVERQQDAWRRKRTVRLRQLHRDVPRSGPARALQLVRDLVLGAKVWFEVLDDFGYLRPEHGCEVVSLAAPDEGDRVRPGTVTDLASVPSVLWGVVPSYGGHTMPAIVHDVQCARARWTGEPDSSQRRRAPQRRSRRRAADALFLQTLRCEAHSGVATRWLMWSAVRLFGVRAALVVLGVVVLGLLDAVTGLAETWPTWWRLAAAGAAVVAVAVAAWEQPPDAERPRLVAGAAGSVLGAAVVAGLTLGPIAVTAIVTWLVSRALALLDGALGVVERVWRRTRPRRGPVPPPPPDATPRVPRTPVRATPCAVDRAAAAEHRTVEIETT